MEKCQEQHAKFSFIYLVVFSFYCGSCAEDKKILKIYKLLDFNDTVDAPASTVTGSLFIELSIKMYNWWRCLVQQVQNSTTRGKKGKQPKGKSLRPKEHQKKRKTENLKTSSELRDACHSPLLPPPLPSPHLAYWLFVSFPLSKHHHSPA